MHGGELPKIDRDVFDVLGNVQLGAQCTELAAAILFGLFATLVLSTNTSRSCGADVLGVSRVLANIATLDGRCSGRSLSERDLGDDVRFADLGTTIDTNFLIVGEVEFGLVTATFDIPDRFGHRRERALFIAFRQTLGASHGSARPCARGC